jgi:hypothetical protein
MLAWLASAAQTARVAGQKRKRESPNITKTRQRDQLPQLPKPPQRATSKKTATQDDQDGTLAVPPTCVDVVPPKCVDCNDDCEYDEYPIVTNDSYPVTIFDGIKRQLCVKCACKRTKGHFDLQCIQYVYPSLSVV